MPRLTAPLFLVAVLAYMTSPGLAQTPAAPTPALPEGFILDPRPPVWPERGSSVTGEAVARDGYTVEIAGEEIRLFGIDAPEMRGDPRGPVSRGALDDILAPDPTVTCEALDMDRYKRPVARCRAGGRDIAEAMVLGGWAFSFRKYATDYDAAEAEARAEGRGFWNGGSEGRGWVEILKELTPLVAIVSAIIAIGGQAWLKRRDRMHERQGVAAALCGEISSWVELVDMEAVRKGVGNAKKALEDPGVAWASMPDSGEESPEAIWKRFPTFMANVEKIGILGPGLAGKTTVFYGMMVRSRFRAVGIEERLANRAKLATEEKAQLGKDLDEFSTLQERIAVLGRGLVKQLNDASRHWRLPKPPPDATGSGA